MFKNLKYFILSVTFLMTILTCANERAITGGKEDKEAPQIISSTPQNESVNIDQNTRIVIRFNEQMKKSSFATALQIWPRPAGGYELKTGWTWLKISFNEALDTNETYLLTLDKSVQDLRGNGLESTFILAFSTGKDLNAGRLIGYIHGDQNLRKNGNLLLYRQFDTPLDDLLKLPADYIFQPDNDGNFELPYLSERSYMLFYHWDRNRNKAIDGDDYFGRPEIATVRAKPDSVLTKHKIWPHLIALDRVKLLEVSQIAEQFVQIRTTRPVTLESLAKIELFSETMKIPIIGANTVTGDKYAMHLNTALTINENESVWLRGFQDTSGFQLNSDTLKLVIPASIDTLELEKLDVNWENGSTDRQPSDSSRIRISSNLPLIFTADSAFQIVDTAVDSVDILGSIEKVNSMAWDFVPHTLIADGLNLKWKIETRFIQVPLNGRELDSLMIGRLTTISEDSLGTLKLIQMGVSTLECNLRSKGLNRTFQLEPGTFFMVEDLPAQQYSLSGFIDLDGDGLYNSGDLGPAASSEPFWIYPSEIKVRARWETDLGIWNLHD
ncbi:Ig-like domain-containing protein [bacterium]|nr:Ig-like domain-containing protein [bacterium]